MTNRLMLTATILILPFLFAANFPQDRTEIGGARPVLIEEKVLGPAKDPSDATASLRRVLQWSKAKPIDKKISEAARAFRQAEPSEREQTEKQLRDLLSEDYDSRLASYDEYLVDLEKKIDKMRAKLAKRRKAKPEMIDLRVKVLEAEADDLGWPSRMSKNRFPTRLKSSSDLDMNNINPFSTR